MSGEHTPAEVYRETHRKIAEARERQLAETAAERDRLQQQLGEATLRIETDARLLHAIGAERDRLKERCEYGEAENLELAHRNAALEAERDGLRAEVERLRGLRQIDVESARALVATLRAEKAELVAALKQIADYSPASTVQPVLIARAALAKATATEGGE